MSGDVVAHQAEGERYDVDAVCASDVPCVANGHAEVVRVANGDTEAIPVRWFDTKTTAGVLLFVAIVLGAGGSHRVALDGLGRRVLGQPAPDEPFEVDGLGSEGMTGEQAAADPPPVFLDAPMS